MHFQVENIELFLICGGIFSIRMVFISRLVRVNCSRREIRNISKVEDSVRQSVEKQSLYENC